MIDDSIVGRPRATVLTLPPYRPGRAKLESGVPPVKLSSNELPYAPLPSVVGALATALGTAQIYPDNRSTQLCEAIAAAHSVDPERVTVGSGSVGLLQQLALGYLEPGDTCVFGDPSFEAYPIFANLASARAVRVPTRRQTLDLEAMVAAVDGSTRLVMIANPNNPTGTALGDGEIAYLVDSVPRTCLVVLDEAYREFLGAGAVDASVELVGQQPNVVVLRTFSKAHGLANLRVGYAIAHPDVIRVLDHVRLPFTVNGLAQVAALASLSAVAEMRERVTTVTTERARVERRMRSLGWSVPIPRANFVWLPAGRETDRIAARLDQHNVITRAFSGVGIRVTIGTTDANDRFLEAFVASTVDIDASAWQLPIGDGARHVQAVLDSLAGALARLSQHADAPAPDDWLTDADPATGERWDTGQVWAHMAEFGSYWQRELRRIVDAPASLHEVPFGRTKGDAHRIAMIETGRHLPIVAHLATIRGDADRLANELAQLSPTDWARRGLHPTLGSMSIDEFLHEFAIGHYHEHADQLDVLTRTSA